VTEQPLRARHHPHGPTSAEHLPEAVAFAAHEFIAGPLLAEPHRIGKQLRAYR